MNEQPELKWLPIEPTPEEIEWTRRMEEFQRQLLTMFALPPELLGVQDMNRAYDQHQTVRGTASER